jgi:hypothetical protein
MSKRQGVRPNTTRRIRIADIIDDQGSSTHKEKERWGALVLTSKPDQMLSARRTCSSEYLKVEAAPRADFVQARRQSSARPGHLPARQNVDNPPWRSLPAARGLQLEEFRMAATRATRPPLL